MDDRWLLLISAGALIVSILNFATMFTLRARVKKSEDFCSLYMSVLKNRVVKIEEKLK